MSIIGLVIFLVVIGFCLWLALTFIPMPQPIKTVIIAVVAFAVVLYILNATGVYSTSHWIRP